MLHAYNFNHAALQYYLHAASVCTAITWQTIFGCRTRAKQEADAAAELQKDLARIEELTVEIR